MHGGFQSLILDEVMSWATWSANQGTVFVTREIRLKFIKPVRVDTELRFIGRVADDDGKTVKTRGEIRDASGNVLTEAEGKLVRVKRERLEKILGQTGGGK